MQGSVFAELDTESYPFRFNVTLDLANIVGGVPSDPKVAEGWLRTKLGEETNDVRIAEMVAEVMETRKVTQDEAIAEVNKFKNLNGFKRTTSGNLYIEGRQIKAMLKEAVSIAVAANKMEMIGWGATRKWLTKFFPEHVFVVESTVMLKQRDEDDKLVPVNEPTGIHQQFVHTHRGSAIQYQEFVDDAVAAFTIISDHPFTMRDWGMMMTTGEQNGLGASRSQGYGTFAVTKWEDVSTAFVPQTGTSNTAPKKAVAAKKTTKAAAAVQAEVVED